MIIDSKLTSLRTKLRRESKNIIAHVLQNHLYRNDVNVRSKTTNEICIFCGSKNEITKEHVLPKWTFENCPTKFFITGVNGQSQNYSKTTIPACSHCNNNVLSYLERYIVEVCKTTDLSKSFFDKDEIHNIIRWLEIIEYKFQILEARRTFISSKESGYVPYLANFPLSVMRESVNYSPAKATAEIRPSQKRVTIKSKKEKENSLIVFRTKNIGFHFFHQLNDFIFIELPVYKVAFFYFYNKIFETEIDANCEAKKVIDKIYNA